MTMTMTEATIRLFKGAITSESPVSDSLFAKVNQESTKHGIIVPKEICSENLYEYFKTLKVNNRNTTFYKSWNSVISKDRFELFLDQITHYLSTYGTNFNGETYIPNKNPEKIPFDLYTVLKTLNRNEIIEGCEKLISASVALDENTIKDILTIFECLSHKVDHNIIKNKEILMHIHSISNTIPLNPVEMVRFLVFKSCNKTLLIKDKATIGDIKLNSIDLANIMKQCGLENLASTFFRFKPIFLAFRSNKNNAACVNKIRKLANKHHKPMTSGYFETILSNKRDLEEVAQKLETLNNFKKVVLLNTINNRLYNQSNFSPYLIRNGRMYVKDNTSKNNEVKDAEFLVHLEYLEKLYEVIYSSLVKNIAKKACNVILPKAIKLAMPTSAKKFIGEIPIGSSVNLDDTDNIIGIHWRNEDGARDIDLSNIDISGNKIGWNSEYYNGNNSIVYSGDVTNANPEATELLYASGNFSPSVINVNLYNGEAGSKFELFIAQEKITNLRANYMVDPNNIIFKTPCVFESEREQILGITTNKKFVFQNIKINARNVSCGSNWKTGYIEHVVDSMEYILMLENVLKDAGFTFIDEDGKDAIDLSNFSKEQLLSLVS